MAVIQADIEKQLPLVRRGYDPYEVQRLVGQLSNELKALARANEELRSRVARIEQHPPVVRLDRPPAAAPTDDAHRHAAEVIAAAEREGNAIRHRARLDADKILELAHQRVHEIEHQQAATADQLRAAQAQIQHLLALLGDTAS